MEKAGLGMNGWLARLAFQLPDGWVGVLLTPKVSVSCLGFATATSHLYLYLPPPYPHEPLYPPYPLNYVIMRSLADRIVAT
jgi:hypothetical protein